MNKLSGPERILELNGTDIGCPEFCDQTTLIDANKKETYKNNSMSSPASPLGTHLIVEFYGCSRIDDSEFVRSEIVRAAIVSGATVLQADIHDFGEGFGVTGIVLLAESHISIHTWPEYGYAAIDIFLCGHANPKTAVETLQVSFRAARVETVEHFRGAMCLSELTRES